MVKALAEAELAASGSQEACAAFIFGGLLVKFDLFKRNFGDVKVCD